MPQEEVRNTPNWDEDVGALMLGENYYFYLPRLCNHCTNPACLEACPRKAIYKRAEDGIVLVDQEQCEGYRYCMKACPYKKIYFNELLGKAQKCIFCYPRIEKGEVNACAKQCPGRLRWGSWMTRNPPSTNWFTFTKSRWGCSRKKAPSPTSSTCPPSTHRGRAATGRACSKIPACRWTT